MPVVMKWSLPPGWAVVNGRRAGGPARLVLRAPNGRRWATERPRTEVVPVVKVMHLSGVFARGEPIDAIPPVGLVPAWLEEIERQRCRECCAFKDIESFALRDGQRSRSCQACERRRRAAIRRRNRTSCPKCGGPADARALRPSPLGHEGLVCRVCFAEEAMRAPPDPGEDERVETVIAAARQQLETRVLDGPRPHSSFVDLDRARTMMAAGFGGVP